MEYLFAMVRSAAGSGNLGLIHVLIWYNVGHPAVDESVWWVWVGPVVLCGTCVEAREMWSVVLGTGGAGVDV